MLLKLNKKILKIGIYLTFFIFVAQLFMSCLDLDQIERENIQRVKNIDAREVEKIEIFAIRYQHKDQENKLIKTLSERNEIESFVNCLRSLKHVHPNHPHYPNRWYVIIVMDGKENEELKLMQRVGDKQHLYVQCIGHKWIGSAAMAVSYDLNRWMDKNIGLPIIE